MSHQQQQQRQRQQVLPLQLTFSHTMLNHSPCQQSAYPSPSPLCFVTGAIQTIEKLLKNAEKRAAAITTLGKTVERCRPKLGAANPAFLASLFNVLDGVTEQTFQYDIEWINNNMQRTRPQQVGRWFVC
jgi:hypothetical protein